VRTKTAVEGWATIDPTVTVTYDDIPGDGRFVVGKRAQVLGDGYTRWFYAVHNLNSDRSAKAFTVNFASAANVRALWFNDVDYHSGEPYAGTDWLPTIFLQCDHVVDGGLLFESERQRAPLGHLLFVRVRIGRRSPVRSHHAVQARRRRRDVPPAARDSFARGYGSTPVAYDFVPGVPTSGTAGPATDDSAATVPLGFTFNFWGTNYTQMVISSNGYLAIPGQSGTVYANTAIPAAAVPNGIICGYWDDLNPAATGSGKIWYQNHRNRSESSVRRPLERRLRLRHHAARRLPNHPR
jgi:hypothetical protein